MILLVCGPSGVGKTSLAQKISHAFQTPVFHKDDLKEILFDKLGCKNREEPKILGKASWKLLYHLIESQLKVQKSVIIESNFKAEFDEPKLKALQKKYQIPMLVIMYQADPEVIKKRFRDRQKAGKRHPGHHDHLITDEILDQCTEKGSEALNLGCPTIKMDLNDFDKLDHKKLFDEIKKAMKMSE